MNEPSGAHATARRGSLPPPRTPQRRIQCIGHYDLEKTIGQGQFGKVKLATHVLTGEKVAVKIVLKSKLDEDTLKKVYREVRIMKLLNHPNIIRLYEVIETEKVMFLVMEHASGGEVLDFIVAHGRLPEVQARKFFQQIVSAVDYCHKFHVVHRDIKCENLLLDADLNVKIIDFGLSNSFTPGALMQTFCGSPTYCAPELIQRHKYEGPEVDVWSLGVVLFVLVCGYLPFDAKDFQTLFRKVLSGAYHIPEWVSDDCASLIRRMLVGQPENRATLAEVRMHPWMQMDSKPFESNLTIPPEVKNASEIDEQVVQQLGQLGFPPDIVHDAVLNAKYDVIASTYYLMVAKKMKAAQPPGQRAQESSPRLLQIAQQDEEYGVPTPEPTTRGSRGHRRIRTEGHSRPAQPPPAQQNPNPTASPRLSGSNLKVSSSNSHQSAQHQQHLQPQPHYQNQQHQRVASQQHYTQSTQPQPSHHQPPAIYVQNASPTAQSTQLHPPSDGAKPALAPFLKHQGGHKRARSVGTTQRAPEPAIASPRIDEAEEEYAIIKPKEKPTRRTGLRNSDRREESRNPLAAGRRNRPKSVGPWMLEPAGDTEEGEVRTIEDEDGDESVLHTQSAGGKSSSRSSLTKDFKGLAIDTIDEEEDGGKRAARSPREKQPQAQKSAGKPHRGHRRAQSLGVHATQVEDKSETQQRIEEYERNQMSRDPVPMKSPRGSSLNAFMNSFKNAIGMMRKPDYSTTSPTMPRRRDTNPQPQEPRTMRFALNVSMTSPKSPEEIMQSVFDVLEDNGIAYSLSQPFCVLCKHKYNNDDVLIFEIEVCKLPMLNMNGLRLNRISGDAWVYKRVAADLIESMDL